MGQRSSIPDTFGSNCEYTYGRTDAVGKGGFGTVYKATITKRGKYAGQKTVAVKEIRLFSEELEQLNNPETKHRFEKRWKLLLQLKHPNVVPYYKITVLNGSHLAIVEFLMDYYEDGDFFSYLKWLKKLRRPLRQPHMISYGKQISCGLQFLHEQGIIHGDLKPSNILMRRLPDGTRTLVIGDLDDLVQMQTNVTCSKDMHGLHGTFRYMSPEMLQKFTVNTSMHIGRKTDIWSLGCILLNMAESCFKIHEKWLIRGDTLETFDLNQDCPDSAFIIKVIDGFVPYVPIVIPEDIRRILRMCLFSSHESRPSTDELSKLLDSVLWDFITLSSLRNGTSTYNIISEDIIGRGKFGLVHYKASGIPCNHTNEPGQDLNAHLVSVKRIMAHAMQSPLSEPSTKKNVVLDDVFAISDTLLRLQHENITTFHKIAIKRSAVLLAVDFVLDFYPDGNLDVYLQHLRDCGLTIFEVHALDSFRQMALGVQFLHQNKITHLNLALENVFTKSVPNKGRNFAIGNWDEAILSQQEIATPNPCILSRRSRDRFSFTSDNVSFPPVDPDSNPRKKYASDIEAIGHIFLKVSGQVADTERHTWHSKLDSEIPGQLRTCDLLMIEDSDVEAGQIMDIIPENLQNVVSLCFQTGSSADDVLAATDTTSGTLHYEVCILDDEHISLSTSHPAISSTGTNEEPIVKNEETGSFWVVWPL